MSDSATANIGVVGLAVMGRNLARNLAPRGQHRRGVQPLARADDARCVDEHPEAEFVAPRDATRSSSRRWRSRARRSSWCKAGDRAPTRSSTSSSPLFEPGDIIVDGGNAHFHDTIRREKALRETGIHFVGAGISGGEEGALNGPSIMPGGSTESYETLGPILESIAAQRRRRAVRAPTWAPTAPATSSRWCTTASSTPTCSSSPRPTTCCAGGRPDGPPRSPTSSPSGTPASSSPTSSRSPPRCCARSTPRPGSRSSTSSSTRPSRRAPAAGPCRTPSTSASRCPASPRRCSPARPPATRPAREARAAVLGRARAPVAGRRRRRRSSTTCATRSAPSKVVAYAQGFDADPHGAARVRLGRRHRRRSRGSGAAAASSAPASSTAISDAYADGPRARDARSWPRTSPTAWPTRQECLAPRGRRGDDGRHPGARLLRRRSRTTTAVRAERLPAALVQGQRDFFGAHTYKRVDKEGTFHTLWSGDRTEIEI